jgi:hypothetical protein
MAEALRKVSLNYNWTIKRAQNDLHHNIIATPQPQPLPITDTKPGDFSVLPWDVSVLSSISDGGPGSRLKKGRQSNRLRWKFKNDCEELREHLERVFLILFGWAVTLNHLRPIATRHFIVSLCGSPPPLTLMTH